jgi:alpha-L-fucosidase
MYGEGPTLVAAGHFGEKKIPDFTAQDIRFTVRGNTLYAIVCGWPENQRVTIPALHSGQELPCGQVGNVAMLGSQQPLAWRRDEIGITIEFPDQQPCDHAVVLKLEGSPVLNK